MFATVLLTRELYGALLLTDGQFFCGLFFMHLTV